jgi:hypothetical protein
MTASNRLWRAVPPETAVGTMHHALLAVACSSACDESRAALHSVRLDEKSTRCVGMHLLSVKCVP